MEKWNSYTCPECGGVTIARHDQEGTTPFMIRCRAKDIWGTFNGKRARVEGCRGMAESSFFRCSQDDDQIPHVVFFRPDDAAGAIASINQEPKRFRAAMLEHYQLGGSLMREIDPMEHIVASHP